MKYPSPSRAEVLAALTRFGVSYVLAPLRAQAEGRPWSQGMRAIVDHHTAGVDSIGYLSNTGGTYPFVNALVDRDGRVHILSTQSVWGSVEGGPWAGISPANKLNEVAWQNEVEDMGKGLTFTPAQLASLGKLNAALVSLGVPAADEINHRDWTDGNPPVGGRPLPTIGRKVDTRYSGTFLRANTAKYTPHAAPVAAPRMDTEMLLVMTPATDAVYLLSGNQLSHVATLDDLHELEAAGVPGPVSLSAATFAALTAAKD